MGGEGRGFCWFEWGGWGGWMVRGLLGGGDRVGVEWGGVFQ